MKKSITEKQLNSVIKNVINEITKPNYLYPPKSDMDKLIQDIGGHLIAIESLGRNNFNLLRNNPEMNEIVRSAIELKAKCYKEWYKELKLNKTNSDRF